MLISIAAVSRDCFPVSLSERRLNSVVDSAKAIGLELLKCPVIIEKESDVMQALAFLNSSCADALVIYLGNFGPEGPETMLAQKFGKPVMFAAAAEESKDDLINGRGDAYCGMLSASYNLGLRGVNAYIPEYPIGTFDEVAAMIAEFASVAQTKKALSELKIITFGPRPYDFLACNAPIKGLFDIGVEVQENSELDLYESFLKHSGDPRREKIAAEMTGELTEKGVTYPDLILKLAEYELTLLDWAEANKGASKHVIFANKCWPAFQTMFKFVPCYVNSRLAAKGMPVACEADIYGALSEFILYNVTGKPSTLLDINNSVPRDLYEAYKEKIPYKFDDLFMGFHCGNTAKCLLKNDAALKYQLIMKRSLEPDTAPNISRGTLEGDIAASPVTLFRLQYTVDSQFKAYIAEGETLDVPSHSFGSIGVFAIPEMARFYRHVLIEKRFPHHSGVGFTHCGKVLFEIMKQLNIKDIGYNRPAALLYDTENPFKK